MSTGRKVCARSTGSEPSGTPSKADWLARSLPDADRLRLLGDPLAESDDGEDVEAMYELEEEATGLVAVKCTARACRVVYCYTSAMAACDVTEQRMLALFLPNNSPQIVASFFSTEVRGSSSGDTFSSSSGSAAAHDHGKNTGKAKDEGHVVHN